MYFVSPSNFIASFIHFSASFSLLFSIAINDFNSHSSTFTLFTSLTEGGCKFLDTPLHILGVPNTIFVSAFDFISFNFMMASFNFSFSPFLYPIIPCVNTSTPCTSKFNSFKSTVSLAKASFQLSVSVKLISSCVII